MLRFGCLHWNYNQSQTVEHETPFIDRTKKSLWYCFVLQLKNILIYNIIKWKHFSKYYNLFYVLTFECLRINMAQIFMICKSVTQKIQRMKHEKRKMRRSFENLYFFVTIRDQQIDVEKKVVDIFPFFKF